MSERFIFIPPSHHSGHLIHMYFCKECGCPKKFDQFCMINFWTYPRPELGAPFNCFMCDKLFDGNTAAYSVTIELTEAPKEKNDERDTNL